MNFTGGLREYLETEKRILSELDLDAVNRLMEMMEEARLNHQRIFLCGNGGSAATASHFVCDFCKGVSLDQEIRYDMECLNDNVPHLTAIANDISYDDVFVIPCGPSCTPEIWSSPFPAAEIRRMWCGLSAMQKSTADAQRCWWAMAAENCWSWRTTPCM